MKFIVGNWKMYPKSFSDAREIFKDIRKVVNTHRHVKIVICPPAIFVAPFLSLRKKAKISIGAQNASQYNEGAYTGETSPAALASLGASHVILGHSERRQLGEDDDVIAQKASTAARANLTVILCIGEKERDSAGAYFSHVRDQLRRSLHKFPKTEAKRLIIAYEPIWAIGAQSARAAESADFREMRIFIRRYLVEHFGQKAGFAVPILYGGSVDERNALGFLTDGEADGLLIGRVSLDPQKFNSVIHGAEHLH